MTTPSNELRREIEKHILTLSLGYNYQMSDYAGSREQEMKYERDGLREVRKVAKKIANTLEAHTQQAVEEALVELQGWSFSELDEANKDGLEVSDLWRDKVSSILATLSTNKPNKE